MRIDYSEPRHSSGAPAPHAPRKAESSSGGSMLTFLVLAGAVFVIGFGTGWFFSQKSAKKAFRAAMEQQSLESSKKQPDQQPSVQPPAVAQGADQPARTVQPQQQASPAGQIPLTFFENLPRGHKQTVLGSGINEKPKPAMPPAAAPLAVQTTNTAPVATKPADVKNTSNGYTVQVAAFNSAKEAEAAKARLSSKGYSASVVEINLNDKGTWYRVRIGRHLEKEAASEIASRIAGGAKILPDQE